MVLLLMILMLATALVALYYALAAIVRMSPHTRAAIRAGFIAKACGLAMVVAAVVDYVLGDPYAWPGLLLAGVTLTNAGAACIHMANRRQCMCPECSRRQVIRFADPKLT